MDIILFIIVLGLNILIHEFAHFYFARKANILCHEFAIGMGPVVYKKKKGETTYSLRLIPIGGYVSMAGEEVADFVKKGNIIGINLDANGFVNEIVLNDASKYEVIGKVIDFDLYGLDNKELFVLLNVGGEEVKYLVNVDAMYVLNNKKQMQLSVANRSYENKTLWQRLKVVLAGPVSNFVLAFFILFVLAFFIGKPVNNTKIGEVSEYASSEGLNAGDSITKVNGEEVLNFNDLAKMLNENMSNKVNVEVNGDKMLELDLGIVFQGLGFTNVQGEDKLIVGQVFGRRKNILSGDLIKGIIMGDKLTAGDVDYFEPETWNELIDYVKNNSKAQNIKIKLLRDGSLVYEQYNNINEKTLNKLDASYIHYSIGITGTSKFNLLYPLYYPFIKVGSDMKQMFNTIILLITPNSGVGIGDLSGPVGIFSLVSDARSQGFASFMVFFAFISINIGFLNLMPIPALDGGRIVFIIYEAITKKKVNKNVENILITITFFLLIGLTLFVTFNDVLRIFG